MSPSIAPPPPPLGLGAAPLLELLLPELLDVPPELLLPELLDVPPELLPEPLLLELPPLLEPAASSAAYAASAWMNP